MEGLAYLDNNAATPVAAEVFEAMVPFLSGRTDLRSDEEASAVELARERVAALIGAHPDEIVFTSGGTEADNAALACLPEGRLVTTSVEHAAVLRPAREHERAGRPVVFLGVDSDGMPDLDAYRRALCGAAGVSVMWANNETGVVFPIHDMAAMAAECGASFHTDAVQAAGKASIDVGVVPVDYLSISGHKLHAPKGVGALFIRRGARRRCVIAGRDDYECGNVAAIAGFGAAAQLAAVDAEAKAVQMNALRETLERGILESCDGSSIIGANAPRLPNTTCVVLDGLPGESVVMELDRAGVAAGSGSACLSGSTEPSHVLLAMGVPHDRAMGAVRFSLSGLTTEADIGRALDALPQVLHRLRKRARFGRELGPKPECKGKD